MKEIQVAKNVCPKCGSERSLESLKCSRCGYTPKLHKALSGTETEGTTSVSNISEPDLTEWERNFGGYSGYTEESMREVRRQFRRQRLRRPLMIIIALGILLGVSTLYILI